MDKSYWSRAQRARLNRRRLLGVAGAAAAAAMAAACKGNAAKQSSPAAGPSNSASPVPGGTLSVSQKNNPGTLDPHRTTSDDTEVIAGATLSRLLRFKTGPTIDVSENRIPESDLALSVESPDAVTWTVKLRTDAMFHNIAPVNGRAVEAEDIKASFTRAINPANPGRGTYDMIDPAQITTPDKNTVVFKLKYAYSPFTKLLASDSYGWILPREAAAGGYDPAKQVIGSGPFVFDTLTPDVAITYKRNANWHFKPQPYVDAIRWAIVVDAAQMRSQFTGGHLDMIGGADSVAVTPNDVEPLKSQNPKATLYNGSPAAGQLLFFQLGDPVSPFQDVRLRRAFSMSIDRDALAKSVYNNDTEPQWYAYLAIGKSALHQADIPAATLEYYKYNVAEAKKLLSAAGADNRQFKLVYATGYLTPAYETAAQSIVNMLSGAGIKVSLVAVDYVKDFIAGGKGMRYGNYPSDTIVFAGISPSPDIDGYVYNYYDSKSTSAPSRLNDAKVDEMISKARAIVDDDARQKAYLDIQRYLADQVYTVGGFPQPRTHSFAGPRLANYQPSVSYGAATEAFSKLWLKG
jgi:peptide/nickel transport system substrate-binding protein